MEGDFDKKNDAVQGAHAVRSHICTQGHVQTQEKRQASAEKRTKIQALILVARKVTAPTTALTWTTQKKLCFCAV